MTRTAAQDQDRWNEYWTRYASEYDEHQLSRLAHADERATWSRIWAEALPTGTRTVLDVGTGTGNVALQLAADGYEVTGIDLSEGMLERARAKCAGHPAPPTFLRGDAVQPPFPRGSFDAIVSRYVLWTLRDSASARRSRVPRRPRRRRRGGGAAAAAARGRRRDGGAAQVHRAGGGAPAAAGGTTCLWGAWPHRPSELRRPPGTRS